MRIPDPSEVARLDQDEEWCEVRLGRSWRRIRLHDYDALFSIPGLYERVVYELLECRSPRVLCSMLSRQLAKTEGAARPDVLDLGAGNGCVAAELRRIGVGDIVGLDILPEAAQAAQRDRPGLYEDYVVGDLRALPRDIRRRLEGRGLGCLVSVAALGFGDIPVEVFVEAYDLIEPRGWIAFTIKKEFLELGDESGFAGLVRRMVHSPDRFEVRERAEFVHRRSMAGDELRYVAIVGRKRGALEIAA